MASSRKDSRGRVLHTGEYEERKKNKNGEAVSYYVYKYQNMNGKRSRISATSLPELREKEKELQKDLFDGIRTGKENERTVGDVVRIYLETKINLKTTTAANYEYMADKYIIGGPFGGMNVRDLTKSMIEKYYGDLLKSGWKATSIEAIQTILQPALQRAVDDGYIRINPSNGVLSDLRSSKLWTKPHRRALTIEEQEIFIRYTSGSRTYSHWMPVFTFLLGTGCRIGEASGLCWEDVNFRDNVITIRHNLINQRLNPKKEEHGHMVWVMNDPKTEDGKREVPLLQEVRHVLLKLRAEQMAENVGPFEIGDESYRLVFRNTDGGPLHPIYVNRAIARIVRDYNKEEKAAAAKEGREAKLLERFSVHQLRHTFCTRLCENSSNVKAIQAIMGHADIKTTMNVYAEATKESKRNTLDELEGKIKIS